MTAFITDAVLDGIKDGALSIPVLFIAYILMEMLERSQRLNESILRGYSRKAGPALGAFLGAVPQCGISGAAATLFSTGAITIGTMLAVFFATSDEMLPIMLGALTGKNIAVSAILLILLSKTILGMGLGYITDGILGKWFLAQKDIHSFCEREHCSCDDDEGSVLGSAVRHTLKIAIMLILVTIALNLLLETIGVERLSGSLLNKPVIGDILLAIFGLVPNCSVSVVLTQGYLNGVFTLGGLFAGLLSNAGIGLLVLLRTNKSRKENAIVVATMLTLSALTGSLISLISLLIA